MSKMTLEPAAPAPNGTVVLPQVGALAVSARHAAWLSPDGEIEELDPDAAAARAADGALVCHAKSVARRLGIGSFPAYDLLDLFAFVHPAQFCLPTIRGMARRLGLEKPRDLDGECVAMIAIARHLLTDLAQGRADARSDPAGLAEIMHRGGWSWGPLFWPRSA